MNDPTSYYTADQLLSVDGCICDKVRVVLDEKRENRGATIGTTRQKSTAT